MPFWNKIIILVVFSGVKVDKMNENIKEIRGRTKCIETSSKMQTSSKICWSDNLNRHSTFDIRD